MQTVTSEEVRRPAARVPMTQQETLEHCKSRTTTNVENLSRITGIGQNQIYEAIARGEWTATRVLRVGRSIKIPTADILSMLGLGEQVSA